MTRAERRFGVFMLACGVLYILGGLSFWILPELNQSIAGVAGRALGLPERPALPAPMWFALGVSMMLTIGTCCLLAGMDPRRNRAFALPVVVSKGASTLVGGVAVLTGTAQASALGVALTDLPLFVATVWLLWAAARSVNGSVLRGGPPD